MKALTHKLIPYFVFLFLTGCTSMCKKTHYDMTPEEVVEAYLDTALNMQRVEEKAELLKLATGNLKDSLASADAETIKST